MYIDSNTRIQILDTIDQLPDAEKDQCGAFIRSDRSVILWSYSLENIIPICNEFDEKLIKHIWRNRDSLGHRQTPSVFSYISRPGSSRPGSQGGTGNPSPLGALSPSESQDQLEPKEKEVMEELPVITPPPAAKRPSFLRWWRLEPRTSTDPPKDPEKGSLKKTERKLVLIGPIYAGCGAGLAGCKYSSRHTFPPD